MPRTAWAGRRATRKDAHVQSTPGPLPSDRAATDGHDNNKETVGNQTEHRSTSRDAEECEQALTSTHVSATSQLIPSSVSQRNSRVNAIPLTVKAFDLFRTSKELLSFYEGLLYSLESDGEAADDLYELFRQNWLPFQSYKEKYIQAGAKVDEHYVNVANVAAETDDVDQQGHAAFVQALKFVNYAIFAHHVFQLPLRGDSPPTKEAMLDLRLALEQDQRWQLRHPSELTEARKVFWTYVTPLDNGDFFMFDDALDAYIGICCQIAVHAVLAHGAELRDQRHDADIDASFDIVGTRQSIKEFYQDRTPEVRAALDKSIDRIKTKSKQASKRLKKDAKTSSSLADKYSLLGMTHKCIYYVTCAAHKTEAHDAFSGPIDALLTTLIAESSRDPSPEHAEQIGGNNETPSSAQQPMQRKYVDYVFKENHQLQPRDPGVPVIRFPRGPVQRHIVTEFEEGDPDTFLENVARATRSNKATSTIASVPQSSVKGSAAGIREPTPAAHEMDIVGDDSANSPMSSANTQSQSRQQSAASTGHVQAQGSNVDAADDGRPAEVDMQPASDINGDDFEVNLSEREIEAQRVSHRRERKRRAVEQKESRKQQRTAEGDDDSQAPAPSGATMDDAEKGDAEAETSTPSSERGRREGSTIQINRYATGNNRSGRVAWTEEETACLMAEVGAIFDAMAEGYSNRNERIYAKILDAHGMQGKKSKILAHRNNVQLKDKVRNEILRLRRDGQPGPKWKDLLYPKL